MPTPALDIPRAASRGAAEQEPRVYYFYSGPSQLCSERSKTTGPPAGRVHVLGTHQDQSFWKRILFVAVNLT